MAYRSLTIKQKVNAPLRRPISVQSYTGRAKRDLTIIPGECVCRSEASPSDRNHSSESRPCLKFLPYSSIAIYLYFAARFSAAPVFRAKHHQGHPHFPRYPPHASSHAASHHRGPARITLQHFARGDRVPSGHFTTPSAGPHASLRLSPYLLVPPTRNSLDLHATQLGRMPTLTTPGL